MKLRPLLLLVLALTACEVVSAPPPGATPALPDVSAPPTTVVATPAPPAPDLLAQGLQARAQGDDAAAAAALSLLLQAYPDAAEARTARYYLAERYARRGRYSSAAELLQPLADGPPDAPLYAPALLWLARCHEAAGAHAAAIEAYRRYEALATPIAPYAAMRRAAQHQAIGQRAEAAAAYEQAARSTIVRGERAGSYEKAIALLREQGQPAQALALYGDLLSLAEQPAYRARILGEAAALAQQLGQPDVARAWLLEIVARAPETPQAAAAVDQLRAANDPGLRPADAGPILFAAERWADAIAAFDGAIAQETDPERGIALRRLRGLALRGQGDFPGALAALAEAGALSPNGEAGRQAQLDWVQTLGQSGETERAAQGYVEYAAAYPDDPRAPEALARAAILRERLGDGAGAEQLRLELGRRYPASEPGRSALRALGLAFAAAGRHAGAAAAWQLLADNTTGAPRAEAAFWAARALSAQGDSSAAGERLRQASAAAPNAYYGVRAADLLGGVPQGSLPLDAPITAEDWAALGAWASGWSGAAPSASDALGYDPAVIGDGRLQRAPLLAQAGLDAEAVNEWRAALNEWSEDPAKLVQLARYAHEAGVPTIALQAAEALARMAPEGAPPAPAALERLRFPAPYHALIAREADAFGIDPRLLLALIRQESLFQASATSWVGARGLAQVMPETGAGIAQNLNVADFTGEDLYSPAVSIRFGAFYLSRRISDMGGSLQGGLASYNGGLGNAQRWAGGSQVPDPELFVNAIDFPETAGYVRAVYGFYGAYQRIYAGQ